MTSAVNWAHDVLLEQGFQLQSSTPDRIQDNPWSTVYRFKTDQGFVFLKQVPEKLALEPKVIQLLNSQFHANVPDILAESNNLHCFLMRDAGDSLHVYLKQQMNIGALIKVMQHYVTLQISAIDQKPMFFDAGVPDWGIEKLPTLYQNLIRQEELLRDDGLTKEDLIKLNKLSGKLAQFCEKLARFNIKDTFGHADFHDKNILIHPETEEITFIDLGEVVITHPFFSFHNCLHMATENFGLTDQQCTELRTVYFKPWLELESQKNLSESLSIIHQCWSIHAVLGEYRLMESVNKKDFHQLQGQGRFSKKLRFWIDQCIDTA